MEDYIKCELIGGGSPRHINTFSNLLIVGWPLHTYKDMLCIVAILDCTHAHHVFHYKISDHPIVDCTPIGSATASFMDLVTLHRRTL